MGSFIVTDSGRDFTPAPEGLHSAVLVDAVDHGKVLTPYGTFRKVGLRFQIAIINPEDGKRFLVIRRCNVSLHEKSTLRKFVEALLGRRLSARDARAGVDLETLVGAPCMLQVVHAKQPDGRIYANVENCIPLPSGMPRLEPMDYIRLKDRNDGEQSPEGSGS
jgi:hypothetical protein